MTVTHIDAHGRCTCEWFSSIITNTEHFPKQALRIVPEEDNAGDDLAARYAGSLAHATARGSTGR